MKQSKIQRNDPCPCGSGKKYKKCCMKKSKAEITSDIKNSVISSYTKSSKWFQDILDERTEGEIEYDNVVLREIEKGKSIKKALDIAAQEFPDEALQYDDDNIDEIYAHYDYFVNHVKIMDKINKMSN